MKPEIYKLRINSTCPVCCNPINVRYEDIESGKELICTKCGLKIIIDHETSDKAVEILDKLKNL